MKTRQITILEINFFSPLRIKRFRMIFKLLLISSLLLRFLRPIAIQPNSNFVTVAIWQVFAARTGRPVSSPNALASETQIKNQKMSQISPVRIKRSRMICKLLLISSLLLRFLRPIAIEPNSGLPAAPKNEPPLKMEPIADVIPLTIRGKIPKSSVVA